MKFLKKKRAEGTSDSVSQLTGAIMGVGVILVTTIVFVTATLGSDIEPVAKSGFDALVESLENDQLEDDVTVVNLLDYYIFQGVGCKEKCLCLYNSEGKSVMKECFKKKINISTGNGQIVSGSRKLVSVSKKESEELIVLSGVYQVPRDHCCMCAPTDNTGLNLLCKWVSKAEGKCPGFREYALHYTQYSDNKCLEKGVAIPKEEESDEITEQLGPIGEPELT